MGTVIAMAATDPQETNAELLARLDAMARSGQSPEAIAKSLHLELGVVRGRVYSLMREEAQAARNQHLLNVDESYALGLCWPGLEAAARERGVLEQVQRAYRKIEALLLDSPADTPIAPSHEKPRAHEGVRS